MRKQEERSGLIRILWPTWSRSPRAWVVSFIGRSRAWISVVCGLIHRTMEGFFAKHPTEDPIHGTLAYFIIRYRYRWILTLFKIFLLFMICVHLYYADAGCNSLVCIALMRLWVNKTLFIKNNLSVCIFPSIFNLKVWFYQFEKNKNKRHKFCC
jgi:hypothetical protein